MANLVVQGNRLRFARLGLCDLNNADRSFCTLQNFCPFAVVTTARNST